MKAKQWDALVARVQRRLVECRTTGLTDAQTANELAHTACAYLETINPKEAAA